MKYRADIAGLRAIAVLPIVLFHYEITSVFRGGYIGVDIFFVISGFLITKIIWSDTLSNIFSIKKFYERRIARIFPALFAMLFCCQIVAYVTRLPSQVNYIGKSSFSSILFFSNIFFYRLDSYFDSKLADNPVLHTWSLSVEEQFYILFPLLIVTIRSSVKYRTSVIFALLFASFVLSALQVVREPTAAFYLMPFRAWEFLVGSVIAIGLVPEVKSRQQSELLALAGMMAIVFSVLTFNNQTLFPGLSAAVPCLGAAAVIHAGVNQTNYISRLLGFQPLRFVGEISYSLYLWHWPIFVFAKYEISLDRTAKLSLFCLAILIATASWWLIERPIRHERFSGSLGAGLAAMAVMSVVALGAGPLSSVLRPIPERAQRVADYESYNPNQFMRTNTCFLTSASGSYFAFKPDECLPTSLSRKSVLILGDSHAADLWFGLHVVLSDTNVLQATASGCKPAEKSSGAARCTDLMDFIFNRFLPQRRMDAIVLSARWTLSDIHDAIKTSEVLLRYADKVFIFGPIEEYDQPLPRLLSQAIIQKQELMSMQNLHLVAEPKLADVMMSSITLPAGLEYISIYDALCRPQCRVLLDDDVPLQFDYGHLTKEGSIFLARVVAPQIEKSLK